MSTVIRISNPCYERLKQLNKGFETPSGVIERLLDFYDAHSSADGHHVPSSTEARLPSLKVTESPDLTYKKIVSFSFLGKEYHPRFGYEVLLTVAGELYRRHGEDFDRCLHLGGRKRRYVSRNESELVRPKPIPDSPYYVMAKLENNHIRMVARKLMREFGYSDSDLTIDTN